jgi:hypothetical protein
MIDLLYNVVRKVIVPKYPWIKDIVWTSNYFGGSKYYSLELTVSDDFYFKQTGFSYDKLYDEVKMLFRLIGPDENEFFDDVRFSPENEDD